jgi:hypothetical protein
MSFNKAVIDISNLYSNSLAIGPARCDQPGLPSCYRVGYNAGLLGSGPCPSRHSSEFCRGRSRQVFDLASALFKQSITYTLG